MTAVFLIIIPLLIVGVLVCSLTGEFSAKDHPNKKYLNQKASLLYFRIFAVMCFTAFALDLLNSNSAAPDRLRDLSWIGRLWSVIVFLGLFASPIYIVEWIADNTK